MRAAPHAVRLAALTAVLILIFCFVQPVSAQPGITSPEVEYEFGRSITFRASLEASSPVQNAVVLFGAENSSHTFPGEASVTSDGEIQMTYNLEGQSLQAFSNVEYRFRITFEDGETYTSPFYSFYYEDNRFEWQTLEEEIYRVHWYSGDVTLAQDVLDVAQAGMDRARGLISLTVQDETLDIYVYDNPKDMQDVLGPSSENWVAGHADPEVGVMVVALPPGPDQRLDMEQRIPHELMHLLLYGTMGTKYAELPVWLSEGLASITELYPNPDYQILLNNAYDYESLIPIGDLCSSFPRDASKALLAYAEAASFTRYLRQTEGSAGLDRLLQTYGDGYDCQRGLEVAIGRNLPQLERQWRQAVFGEDGQVSAISQLLPWLFLLAAALGAPLAVVILTTVRRMPTV